MEGQSYDCPETYEPLEVTVTSGAAMEGQSYDCPEIVYEAFRRSVFVPQWRGSLTTARRTSTPAHLRTPANCRNGGAVLRLPGGGVYVVRVLAQTSAAMEGQSYDCPEGACTWCGC